MLSTWLPRPNGLAPTWFSLQAAAVCHDGYAPSVSNIVLRKCYYAYKTVDVVHYCVPSSLTDLAAELAPNSSSGVMIGAALSTPVSAVTEKAAELIAQWDVLVFTVFATLALSFIWLVSGPLTRRHTPRTQNDVRTCTARPRARTHARTHTR